MYILDVTRDAGATPPRPDNPFHREMQCVTERGASSTFRHHGRVDFLWQKDYFHIFVFVRAHFAIRSIECVAMLSFIDC